MFFLSKLLPLLIYPLGLSCLLMALGFFWLWKHPKWASWAIAAAFFVLYFSSNILVSNKLVSSLESQYLPPNPMPTADAIVVLGGATLPALAPRPWVEVSERGDRILYGARLYNQGKAPKLILSGGRITWRGGSGASEAGDMQEIAMAMNVPAADILLAETSLNTRQNAVNVKALMAEQNIDSLLLVTSALHMPRSVAIFKQLGINVTPAPTDYLVPQETFEGAEQTFQARLISLFPDSAAIDQFTAAMKEYVGFLFYRLRGWV